MNMFEEIEREKQDLPKIKNIQKKYLIILLMGIKNLLLLHFLYVFALVLF